MCVSWCSEPRRGVGHPFAMPLPIHLFCCCYESKDRDKRRRCLHPHNSISRWRQQDGDHLQNHCRLRCGIDDDDGDDDHDDADWEYHTAPLRQQMFGSLYIQYRSRSCHRANDQNNRNNQNFLRTLPSGRTSRNHNNRCLHNQKWLGDCL